MTLAVDFPHNTSVCLIVPDATEDLRVPTHPQVVVAAPDGHLGALPPTDGVILGEGVDLDAPVHRLEDSVRVVLPLLAYHLSEEAVVVVGGANCKVDEVDFKHRIKHIYMLYKTLLH